jgi:glycosyltransferase involved in cell wall biosynthesis
LRRLIGGDVCGCAMRILIAVPVFNEERYVVPVMREIRKYARAAAIAHGVEMRLLVVDDGSTDGTPELLRDMAGRGQIQVLTHPENRGYGQSLIDAFDLAARHGFDWVITMDCDEQHEPCRIPLFVRRCLEAEAEGGADIISGSRYLRRGQTSGQATALAEEGVPPPDRRNINRIMTDLLNSTLNLNVLSPCAGCPELRDAGEMEAAGAVGITDAFCGFKAHRVSALRRMDLTIPGYAFPMQFWAQAASLNLVIREMPVKLIYKDATRHFGGMLDDPTARLTHYLEVLTHEIRRLRQRVEAAAAVCGEAECLCE